MIGLRISKRSYSQIVERCPAPGYDTGCTFCEIPRFPSDKPIDFAKNLNGTKVLPWKHALIFSHGFEDFNKMPSKIELVPGSLSGEINLLKKKLVSAYHPIMVSNALSKYSEIRDLQPNEQLVYLYPDNKKIRFDLKDTKEFIKKYLRPSTEEMSHQEPVYNPFAQPEPQLDLEQQQPANFNETEIDKDLILICGHLARDVRCGLMAPLLKEEFEKVLDKEELTSKIDIGLVSHIGGHAYAGNVIYFPKDKSRKAIWYGRVFPQLVQGIVKETIINGKIIKELYRGDL